MRSDSPWERGEPWNELGGMFTIEIVHHQLPPGKHAASVVSSPRKSLKLYHAMSFRRTQ